MAECSFVDRRGPSVYAAGGSGASSPPPAGAAAAAGSFSGDEYAPYRGIAPRGAAAAAGRGATATPFATAAAGTRGEVRRPRGWLPRLCRGIYRVAVASCCCCGAGTRLLRRLLWVPSSLFLPLEMQGGGDDQQQEEEEGDSSACGMSMRYRGPSFASSSSSSLLPGTSSAAAAAARARAAAAEKIWKSYFFGQLANVAKAAVWWSTFGVLVLALAGPAAAGTAVGLTRAAFNLALVLASPVAGAFVERRSIRGLLATTTATRLLIWSFAVPAAAWLALSSSSLLGGPYQQQQPQQVLWEEQQQPVALLLQQQQQQQDEPKVTIPRDERPLLGKEAMPARDPRQQQQQYLTNDHPLLLQVRQQQQPSSHAGKLLQQHAQGGEKPSAAAATSSSILDRAPGEQRTHYWSRSNSPGSAGGRSSSREGGESSQDSSGSSRSEQGWGYKEAEEDEGNLRGGDAGVLSLFFDFFAAKKDRVVAGSRASEQAGEASAAEDVRDAAVDAELRAAAREERWLTKQEQLLQKQMEAEELLRKQQADETAVVASASLHAGGVLHRGEKGESRGVQQGPTEAEETRPAIIIERRLAAGGDGAEAATAAATIQQRLGEVAVAVAKESPGREANLKAALQQGAASSFAASTQAPAAQARTDADFEQSSAAAAAASHSADMSDPAAPVTAATAAPSLPPDVSSSSSIAPPSPRYTAAVAAADPSAAAAPVSASSAPAVSLETPADAAALPPPAMPSGAGALAKSTAAAGAAPQSFAVSPAAAGAAEESFFNSSSWWALSWVPSIGRTSLWCLLVERQSFVDTAAAAAATAGAATRAAGETVAAVAARVWQWVSAHAVSMGISLTQEQLLWVLVALMFIDGLQVAFANAVDIDCGGLETLGLQYDLPLSEEVRAALNTRHQFVFDFSFIFFTPPVACLVCLVSRLMQARLLFGRDADHGLLLQQQQTGFQGATQSSPGTPYTPASTPAAAGGARLSLLLESSSWSRATAAEKLTGGLKDGCVTDVLPLLLCMSVVFGGLSLLSLLFYCCGLPRKTVQEEQHEEEQRAAAAGGGGAAAAATGREQRGGYYYEEEDEEQQQKLQRQQQRWDFFGSPVNNAAAGTAGAEGRGGGWEGSSSSDACEDDGNNSDIRSTFSSSSGQTVSLFQETVARLEDLREGLAIVLREKALGWRLIFLALETALEDSMVSVVVPQIALTHFYSSGSSTYSEATSGNSGMVGLGHAPWRAAEDAGEARRAALANVKMLPYGSTATVGVGGHGGSSRTDAGDEWVEWLGGRVSAANLFAVCVIAVGKVGGCLAGIYMNRRWVPPASRSRGSSYKLLFWSVFGSSVAVLLLPLSRLLLLRQLVPQWGAVALVLVSTFSFFLFSTAPKIGFASLLQGLVSSQIVACKVFGFVGTFVTLVDACVIAAVNLLFSVFPEPDALHALAAVSAVYFVHGVIEALLGPLVILESPAASDLQLIERQHSNHTLNGSVAELSGSPFGAATEGGALRTPVIQSTGREVDDFDNSWGAPARGEYAHSWSSHTPGAGGAPIGPSSQQNSTAAAAGTAVPRKGRKSQENSLSEGKFAVGNRKTNSSRQPCTGTAAEVDMR